METKLRTERDVFELWLERVFPGAGTERDGASYFDMFTHGAWMGWMARSGQLLRPADSADDV